MALVSNRSQRHLKDTFKVSFDQWWWVVCPAFGVGCNVFGNLEEFAYRIEMIQTLAPHSIFFSALATNSVVPRFPAESSLFSLLSSPLPPHPCSHVFVCFFFFFILVHFQTIYSLSFLALDWRKETYNLVVTSSYITLSARCLFWCEIWDAKPQSLDCTCFNKSRMFVAMSNIIAY